MPKLSEILGEHFKQIPEDLQKKYKDIDLVDSSNYVEKKELETANSSIKEYKKQLKDRDNQINELKEEYKDVDGLKDKLTKLEEENKNQKEEHEKQLAKIEFQNALNKALDNYNVKDKEVVTKLLDEDKLKQDGKDIIGLKEQMEIMQKERSYLFEEEQPGGTGSIGGGPSSFSNNTDQPKSIGEVLGKQQADQVKINETIDSFFK
ncbi:phage scaffolding protein [Clostridium tetani]|uniref:Phage scaffold protein n=1 Tax=Clostridium tetani TaxID=1513 RepID=A0ABY0EPZ3_CLOTA|nr:phage scaffolding protein [Clostridium tetani]CDI49172.1 phage scaffold protein [Clostridium tetani 12124569]AVP54525.1 phage scaffold protein [Clostridium tetani]KHO39511.1 hypothetical protein OR62_05545 [Clostridium tetani]RXI52668.1 phage scaffold protein [Clostridium tetani]RXI68590.1 phage scaffold protein [Clostridium tetani]